MEESFKNQISGVDMPIACFNSQQKLSLEDLHKIKADKIPGSADRQLVATVKITAL